MPEPRIALQAVPGRASRSADRRDVLAIAVLAALAAGALAAFLTVGVTGNIGYIISRRTTTAIALVLVAIAIAVSTVAFQTLTANRILTPSIMGLDSLYVLLQTAAVHAFGLAGLSGLGPMPRFLAETGLLLALAVALYGRMLRGRTDMTRLLLIGVVIGMLFRGLSSFLQRVLAPDAFAVLQDRMFASFSRANAELLPLAGALLAAGVAIIVLERRRMDVLALGPDVARALGVDPDRVRLRLLGAVALLVSVSTALVGPVTFFGLIVAHVAYRLIRRQRHAALLPAASLAAIAALVGGQTIVEHALPFEASLSIIIELVGGLAFIALITRRPRP